MGMTAGGISKQKVATVIVAIDGTLALAFWLALPELTILGDQSGLPLAIYSSASNLNLIFLITISTPSNELLIVVKFPLS